MYFLFCSNDSVRSLPHGIQLIQLSRRFLRGLNLNEFWNDYVLIGLHSLREHKGSRNLFFANECRLGRLRCQVCLIFSPPFSPQIMVFCVEKRRKDKTD